MGNELNEPRRDLMGTRGEENVLAYSSNGAITCAWVHSVWVWVIEITPAYSELHGILFCTKNLLHLI